MWKILACCCFAMLNTIVRYLTGGSGHCENPISSPQITCLQNFFGCMIMIPFIFKSGLESLKTTKIMLHSLRIILAVSGMILLYTAFAHMPIAKVVALGFTGPIFTVLGAKLYLRENLGIFRLFGITLGFVGTFIIMRPDKMLMLSGDENTVFDWFLFLPLLSAIAFAAAKLAGRKLASSGESPQILTVYLLFFMVPVSAVPALLGTWTPPTIEQWGLLCALGCLASAAHYSMARSYQLAEISFVTPFGITRLIFSAFLGYFLFSETIKSMDLWIGAIIIITSTVMLSLEGRKKTPLMNDNEKAVQSKAA